MGCVSSKPEEVVNVESQVAAGGAEHRPTPAAVPAADRVHQENGGSAAVTNATGAATSSTTTPNPNSFDEQYALGKMIGSGTFSVVKEAIHKPTGQKYAVKCIKRQGLTVEDVEALTTEVAILKQVCWRQEDRTNGVMCGVLLTELLLCR
jgi:hypothetical protein